MDETVQVDDCPSLPALIGPCKLSHHLHPIVVIVVVIIVVIVIVVVIIVVVIIVVIVVVVVIVITITIIMIITTKPTKSSRGPIIVKRQKVTFSS